MVRRALPLGEDSRDEWRTRLALWGHQPKPGSELAKRREEEMIRWRDGAARRVARAQADGWIRSDTTPEAMLEQLFSLFVGVAMQIVSAPAAT